jgi:hypothetical protein
MPQNTQWWSSDWQPAVATDREHEMELWRRRLLDARSRHRSAVADLTRIIESNSPEDNAPHPESWKRVLEARFEESDALSLYIEALRVYSALALAPPPRKT